jgi:phosphotransferase system IIA component
MAAVGTLVISLLHSTVVFYVVIIANSLHWILVTVHRYSVTVHRYTGTLLHIGITNVKLIASQARLVNQYENIRSKLQKCCANIYFNKQCITIHMGMTNVKLKEMDFTLPWFEV